MAAQQVTSGLARSRDRACLTAGAAGPSPRRRPRPTRRTRAGTSSGSDEPRSSTSRSAPATTRTPKTVTSSTVTRSAADWRSNRVLSIHRDARRRGDRTTSGPGATADQLSPSTRIPVLERLARPGTSLSHPDAERTFPPMPGCGRLHGPPESPLAIAHDEGRSDRVARLPPRDVFDLPFAVATPGGSHTGRNPFA